MQISPISAFRAMSFKGTHTDGATGISYDAGQPYTRADQLETKKDTFEKRDGDKKAKSAGKADTVEYGSIEEAMAAHAPGYRPEDFKH